MLDKSIYQSSLGDPCFWPPSGTVCQPDRHRKVTLADYRFDDDRGIGYDIE
jgi:hypothetical protein